MILVALQSPPLVFQASSFSRFHFLCFLRLFAAIPVFSVAVRLLCSQEDLSTPLTSHLSLLANHSGRAAI